MNLDLFVAVPADLEAQNYSHAAHAAEPVIRLSSVLSHDLVEELFTFLTTQSAGRFAQTCNRFRDAFKSHGPKPTPDLLENLVLAAEDDKFLEAFRRCIAEPGIRHGYRSYDGPGLVPWYKFNAYKRTPENCSRGDTAKDHNASVLMSNLIIGRNPICLQMFIACVLGDMPPPVNPLGPYDDDVDENGLRRLQRSICVSSGDPIIKAMNEVECPSCFQGLMSIVNKGDELFPINGPAGEDIIGFIRVLLTPGGNAAQLKTTQFGYHVVETLCAYQCHLELDPRQIANCALWDDNIMKKVLPSVLMLDDADSFKKILDISTKRVALRGAPGRPEVIQWMGSSWLLHLAKHNCWRIFDEMWPLFCANAQANPDTVQMGSQESNDGYRQNFQDIIRVTACGIINNHSEDDALKSPPLYFAQLTRVLACWPTNFVALDFDDFQWLSPVFRVFDGCTVNQAEIFAASEFMRSDVVRKAFATHFNRMLTAFLTRFPITCAVTLAWVYGNLRFEAPDVLSAVLVSQWAALCRLNKSERTGDPLLFLCSLARFRENFGRSNPLAEPVMIAASLDNSVALGTIQRWFVRDKRGIAAIWTHEDLGYPFVHGRALHSACHGGQLRAISDLTRQLSAWFKDLTAITATPFPDSDPMCARHFRCFSGALLLYISSNTSLKWEIVKFMLGEINHITSYIISEIEEYEIDHEKGVANGSVDIGLGLSYLNAAYMSLAQDRENRWVYEPESSAQQAVTFKTLTKYFDVDVLAAMRKTVPFRVSQSLHVHWFGGHKPITDAEDLEISPLLIPAMVSSCCECLRSYRDIEYSITRSMVVSHISHTSDHIDSSLSRSLFFATLINQTYRQFGLTDVVRERVAVIKNIINAAVTMLKDAEEGKARDSAVILQRQWVIQDLAQYLLTVLDFPPANLGEHFTAYIFGATAKAFRNKNDGWTGEDLFFRINLALFRTCWARDRHDIVTVVLAQIIDKSSSLHNMFRSESWSALVGAECMRYIKLVELTFSRLSVQTLDFAKCRIISQAAKLQISQHTMMTFPNLWQAELTMSLSSIARITPGHINFIVNRMDQINNVVANCLTAANSAVSQELVPRTDRQAWSVALLKQVGESQGAVTQHLCSGSHKIKIPVDPPKPPAPPKRKAAAQKAKKTGGKVAKKKVSDANNNS